MTHAVSAPAATAGASSMAGVSYVEWGAVFAGAVLAAAASFVLLTFGAAIGLSATSPWPNSGLSVKVIASLAVFWAITQQIGAAMAGGYVAGRMRSRWREPTQHEVEFRDGLHGGLVWAVSILIGAALFMANAGAVLRTGAEVASKTASAASTAIPGDAMDAAIDALLRPQTIGQAATPAQPPQTQGGGGAARARAGAGQSNDDIRVEVSRILASSLASGSLTEQNRTYLTQLVAQRTGISQQEAEKRVNDAVTAVRQGADKARRAAVVTGFVTAAGLILSLGAAWWAAMMGGQHRDTSVPATFGFNRPRRPGLPT
jgi:hypothetical protein